MTETNVSFRNLSPLVSILGPPVAILVLIWMMSLEGFFIEGVRIENFGESTFVPQDVHHDTAKGIPHASFYCSKQYFGDSSDTAVNVLVCIRARG